MESEMLPISVNIAPKIKALITTAVMAIFINVLSEVFIDITSLKECRIITFWKISI